MIQMCGSVKFYQADLCQDFNLPLQQMDFSPISLLILFRPSSSVSFSFFFYQFCLGFPL